MKFCLNLLLINFLYCTLLFSDCPNWLNESSVPFCEKPGGPLLPEIYPNLAHVVSDTPAFANVKEDAPDKEEIHGFQKRNGLKFLLNYVEQVFRLSKEHPPLIFLPVKPESYSTLRKHISELKDVAKETKSVWLKSLIHVEIPLGIHGDEMTWQRDGLITTHDKETGQFSLRRMYDHPGSGRLSVTLAKAMKNACPRIEMGTDVGAPRVNTPGPIDLPPPLDADLSGNFGGNVMGLPGGICVHGNNQTQDVVKQYCPDEKAALSLDVSWLHVGHVDEIISLIKTGNSDKCDFALLMPSTRKALQLLNENGEQLFFDLEYNSVKESLSVERHWLNNEGLKQICEIAKQSLMANESNDTTNSHIKIGSPKQHQEHVLCSKLTNQVVYQSISSNESFAKYQTLIQIKLDELRDQILKRLKDKLNCTPKLIEVPTLYYGAKPVKVKGTYVLPPGKAKSIHPNGVNIVPLDKTPLIPAPRNKVFELAMIDSLKSVLNQPRFIDTWDYSHRAGNGNLHCVTFTVPYCRHR